MARFRLFLIGSPQPLDVNLPANNVAQLGELASSIRFVTGTMAEPDDDGVCCGVLVPTNRIHLAVEADGL